MKIAWLYSKSWWYSFFAAYKALCMVNANVGSNAYTGTVVVGPL